MKFVAKSFSEFVTYFFPFVVGFLVFIYLSEYYNVGIEGDADGYPWGAINDNPWYYNSPEWYSRVMLVEGSLFLFVFLAMIIAKTKKHQAAYKFAKIMFFLVFLASTINSYVQ